MYFIIAPLVLLGLITKLINNKINIQKQNNDFSIDVSSEPLKPTVNSLSDMINNLNKTSYWNRGNQYDPKKYNISSIKKKEKGD